MNDFVDLFWQAYLVNFLFWSGLAQGSVVLVAVLNLTNAGWGKSHVKLAEYAVGFLPVCIVLFAILLLGRAHIFPWVTEPVPGKEWYLNIPFLAWRGLIGLTVMSALSWMFLSRLRRDDTEADRVITSQWAVGLAMAFMVNCSGQAFDLIMSLDPHWYSTLLGAHYAISSFYLGIAGLCLAGCLLGGVPEVDHRKICKLVFGSALFWISLLWSQYIVIWYGDIPEETGFIYLRFYQDPWRLLTIALFVLAFVLPFGLMMSRRAKSTKIVPIVASLCVIAGLALEKYVLTVPSLSPHELAFGWIYILVTAAFAALFGVSCHLFVRWAGAPKQLSSGGS